MSYENPFDPVFLLKICRPKYTNKINYSLWIHRLWKKNQKNINLNSRWTEHYHSLMGLWPNFWTSLNPNFVVSKLELIILWVVGRIVWSVFCKAQNYHMHSNNITDFLPWALHSWPLPPISEIHNVINNKYERRSFLELHSTEKILDTRWWGDELYVVFVTY